MTPEEQKRIYEEEKERQKAKERLKKESQKKIAKQGCIGCFGIIGITTIIALIFGLFSSGNENIDFVTEIRVSKNDGVNVRTGPGTNFDIDVTGQLMKGEKLYVIKDSIQWIKFNTVPNDTSWTGWVKKDLTVSKVNWDLEKYTEELNIIQKELGFKLIDNVSISENTATITVSNQWHVRNKQLRLQDAQTLWRLWANINNPSEVDKARIKIVDGNGNQVGGSGFLGGSIIDVKD